MFHTVATENSEFKMKNFTYAPAELDGFRVGQLYNGYVSYFDRNNADVAALFIIDKPMILDLREEIVETIEFLPMPSVIFGVDLGVNGVFRAVRENNMSPSIPMTSLMLIDTGEVVKASDLRIQRFYKLSRKAQNDPACAVPCKVSKVYDANGREIRLNETYLQHENIEFRVVAVDQPLIFMMLVDIHKKQPADPAFRSTLNPFAEEFYPSKSNEPILKPIAMSEKRLAITHNGVSNDENEENFSPVNAIVTSAQNVESDGCAPKRARENESFTERELQILFEEPKNISNALEAVMGYAPKDESRICRFYNERTGRCFKKNNCRLQHVPIMKDGWTRDRRLSKTKISAIYKLPNVDDIVDIIPLHVESLAEFYAYLPCACPCEADMSPKKLKALMNTERNRLKYKPIDQLPEVLDLIFVQYSDDRFYRAKVIEVSDDDEEFVIQLVDYGHKLNDCGPDRMYNWNDTWDYVPFLARQCFLSNVGPDLPNDEAAINELGLQIKNKRLKASIDLSTTDELYVQLRNESGEDIGRMLNDRYAAVERKILPLHGQRIPA